MRAQNLIALLLLSLVACEGSNGPAVATPASTDLPGQAPAGDPATPPIQGPGAIQGPTATPIKLDGTAPAGKTVVVVDAANVRREAVATEGRFVMADVLPPYDIAVTAADGTPRAWMGATRSDPRLTDPAPATPPTFGYDFDVDVLPLPACAACTISVVTSSLHGSGASGPVDYGAGITGRRVTVSHELKTGSAPEDVTIDAIVDAHDGSHYWYVRGYAAAADLGHAALVQVAPVGSIGVSTVLFHDANVPSTFSRQTYLRLTVGRTAFFDLGFSNGTSYASHIPNIPGAELRAEAVLLGFPAANEKWTADIKTDFVPGSTAQIEIDGALDLEADVPASGTTISTTTSKISWKRAKPAVTRVGYGTTFADAQTVRVFTAQTSVDRARLAMLGISTLAPGDGYISLAHEPATSVDASLASDYTTSGASRRGLHTFPFTVTE